jgi:hypothetical protein
MTYSRGTAYLLWALCLFGVSGIHRFYLGRIGTGILWLCTWGLFGIGNVVDLFTLPRMVDDESTHLPGPASGRRLDLAETADSTESIETVILRAANAHGGVVTPAEVAVGGDYSLDDAKACLDDLVSRGHAEMRVRRSGGMVYVFPDLLTTEAEDLIEPLT